LQIYFGVTIKMDENLNKKISGELELKDKLEDILSGLQNILSYTYTINEEGVYEITSGNKQHGNK
ncbi:MAG: FecR domain-containing protein, partial [Draconibacterium sp.]